LLGTAEAGSTVSIYQDTCAGSAVATGSAAAFASPGIAVSITLNSSHTFFATATDVAGNVSPCSTGIDYVSNTLVPNPPTLSGTTPLSPDNTTTTPHIEGSATAAPGGTAIAFIKLYTDPGCTAVALNNG